MKKKEEAFNKYRWVLTVFSAVVLFALAFALTDSFLKVKNKPVSTPTPTVSPVNKFQNKTVLSVSQINANKEAYTGKRIAVEGKVFFKHYEFAGPCTMEEGCPPDAPLTISLVDRNYSMPPYPGEGDILDLYKNSSSGYVPVSCKPISETVYDCGRQYTKDSIVIIEGVFVKETRSPPNKNIYFLVIQ